MRKKIDEAKRKDFFNTCRIDSETNSLVQEALLKLNTNFEMSLNMFTRLALKNFAKKVLMATDVGIVFQ